MSDPASLPSTLATQGMELVPASLMGRLSCGSAAGQWPCYLAAAARPLLCMETWREPASCSSTSWLAGKAEGLSCPEGGRSCAPSSGSSPGQSPECPRPPGT